MTPSSTIEFLVWLLIAASIIAVIAARLRIPYTVALVLGGLLLGSFHLPILQNLFAHSPDWLTPDVSLVIFLPALLFQGSLKIQFRHLAKILFRFLYLQLWGCWRNSDLRFCAPLGAWNPPSHCIGFWRDCGCNGPHLDTRYFQGHGR